jgi:V-type H+-transporting ATPase subunit F
LLSGIGHVDAKERANFFVVDSKTTIPQVEQAFESFTLSKEIAIVLINQHVIMVLICRLLI